MVNGFIVSMFQRVSKIDDCERQGGGDLHPFRDEHPSLSIQYFWPQKWGFTLLSSEPKKSLLASNGWFSFLMCNF